MESTNQDTSCPPNDMSKNTKKKVNAKVGMKNICKMVGMSMIHAGIQLAYAAELSFATPLLLQLGLPVYLVSICWSISPALGLFVSPILASLSDTCTSRLGRRRPFIIVYSIFITFGLLLLPFGGDLGTLLGDKSLPMNLEDSSANISTNSTEMASDFSPSVLDRVLASDHLRGIILSVIGLSLLDLSCDALQSPSRTLLVENIDNNLQSKGLFTFTSVGGVGTVIGYLIAGVDWLNIFSKDEAASVFTNHVQIVFGVVATAYLISTLITVFSVKERRLEESCEPSRSKNSETRTSDEDIEATTAEGEHATDGASASGSNDSGVEDGVSQQQSCDGEDKSQCTDEPPLYDTIDESTHEEISTTTETASNDDGLSEDFTEDGEDESEFTDEPPLSMKTYLKSIILMPRHMWILCITNLLNWTADSCYIIHLTHFFGTQIFKGDPQSPLGTESRQLYDDGVRTGSLTMIVSGAAAFVFALIQTKFLYKIGLRRLYVGGHVMFLIGMVLLASTRNIYVAFGISLFVGLSQSNMFTVPFVLVARYHTDVEFSKKHQSGGKSRGLGTDIAIVGSMVFYAQIIAGLSVGPIIHLSGTTLVIPIISASLAFICAIVAYNVEYVN